MGKKHGKLSRKNILIFAILAFLIFGICASLALKGADNWTSEIYGSTSDGQIAIQEDTEIDLRFKISSNNFQGISLRLSSQTKLFENETLQFVMTDPETEQILAEYEMPLKHEVYQSTAFARLPYPDAKGKVVSVHITGTNMNNLPYFFVSNNFSEETQMYVNGSLNSSVLVFSCFYLTHSAINYQWIIKGGILLLLLLMIFLWPKKVNKIENTPANPRVSLWFQKHSPRIKNLFQKSKKPLLFLCLSLAYLGLALFVYGEYVEKVIERKIVEAPVNNNSDVEPLVLDSSTGLWEQHFTASQNYLSSLQYNMIVRGADPNAELHVQVYDGNDNICYYDKFIKIKDLEKQSSNDWNIFLESEYTSSGNNDVIVYMEPLDFGETKLEFQSGLSDTRNYVFCGGEKIPVVPALKTVYQDNDYLKTLFMLLCCLLYGFMALIFYLFIVRKASVQQAFVPVTLLLGIIYMLVIPVYSVPDEYTHIDTAYILSNRMLGIDAENTIGYEYKRTIDIETEEAPEYNATLSDYRRLYTSFFDMAEDRSLTSTYTKNALANANIFCYLPAAFGITFGRIIGLGTLPMFLLGRLMNLIAYTLLVYLALKKLPGGKSLAMIYATTPIALQEAASFAYDCVINGVAIVFVSYCLYFAYSQSEKKRTDIAILIASMFFMAGIKGGVYFPICFLIILIPIEQRWQIKKHLGYLFAVLFSIIVAFLQSNIISLLSRFFVDAKSSINSFTGQELYTFGYLIQHPVKWINLYVNTFFTEASQYLYEFFGGKMGSVSNIQMPWMYVIFFFVIFLLMISANHSEGKRKTVWPCIISALFTLASILLINLSMLVADTAASRTSISGVQGRYFIPCLLPLLIMLNYFVKSRHNISIKKLTLIYYLIQVTFVFNIIMVIL